MEIEYCQANRRLIKAALKIAYQRVVDNFGEEWGEKIFKEVVTSLKMELMFPYPAGKIDDAGAEAGDEKKRKKG